MAQNTHGWMIKQERRTPRYTTHQRELTVAKGWHEVTQNLLAEEMANALSTASLRL